MTTNRKCDIIAKIQYVVAMVLSSPLPMQLPVILRNEFNQSVAISARLPRESIFGCWMISLPVVLEVSV